MKDTIAAILATIGSVLFLFAVLYVTWHIHLVAFLGALGVICLFVASSLYNIDD